MHLEKKKQHILRYILISIGLVLFINLFIINFMKITGYSMEPELKNGQMAVINKAAYGILIPFIDQYVITYGFPIIGEIIIFKNPKTGLMSIKRCVGIQEDELKIESGFLYINNYRAPLNLYHENSLRKQKKVPEGHVFVLGDNLDDSIDSRSYGTIPLQNVLGRLIF